ncbi:Ig-like domain-containing protein [Oharaeibacter diazotrophicus]|uniref:Ig-like domain-containing protein n=1 Tax=Oharaeibacter diazotrophicus TaxID=1920512 RepID=A0A4R6RFG1_9HYPH|nr:Ig-like domain-containing protein [Oharaeibacter diazotrophicus]TDP85121.1 Ig-like domain-containing protein [Oharaeibacter diazotrophicus]BBE74091.1 hypothetical protein OHA_1_03718 [Pleomorphomonas sp. SM30]GLS76221.1 hypothetical protein GCM10007904_15560 [Oharaeibacter diazotrophicus]
MSNSNWRRYFAAAVLLTSAFAPAGPALAADTVTALAVSPAKAVYGQPVTFTATVTRKGGTTPVSGGTVAFTRGGVALGSAAVVDGKATLVVPAPKAGAAGATAAFGGSGDDTASTSKAAALLVSYARTTTALTLPGTSFHVKSKFTATATVVASAPSMAVPTGSVQFKLDTKVLGTVALDAAGKASLKLSAPLPRTYQLVATYKPTAKLGFQASTSKTAFVEGTYAASNEVVLATGRDMTYAVATLGRQPAVAWAQRGRNGASKVVNVCYHSSMTTISNVHCRKVVMPAEITLSDLTMSPTGLPTSDGASSVAVAGVITDPDFATKSIWLACIDRTTGLEGTLELADAGRDVLAPALGVLASDNFVLTYAAVDASGASTVFAQIYTQGGIERGPTPVGAPIVVATSAKPVAVTSVATDFSTTTKGFSVGWVVDGAQPFVRRYDGTGKALGEARAIDPVASEGVTELDVEGIGEPMGMVATWTRKATGASAPLDVRIRRHDVGGNGLQLAGIATNPRGSQSQARSTGFTLGGWGTVWTSPDADRTGIYGKLFDKTGKATSADFRLNATTKGAQSAPSIAAVLGVEPDFVAYWLTDNGDGTTSLIARHFVP